MNYLLAIISYFAIGTVWVIVDVLLFKNEYWNPVQTVANFILWPISISIRIWDQIKRRMLN
jgi:hypothetical protein